MVRLLAVPIAGLPAPSGRLVMYDFTDSVSLGPDPSHNVRFRLGGGMPVRLDWNDDRSGRPCSGSPGIVTTIA